MKQDFSKAAETLAFLVASKDILSKDYGLIACL